SWCGDEIGCVALGMGARATMLVLCGLPGCTQPCYDDGLVVHDYCGRTHARQAMSGGLVAGARRPLTGSTCKRPGCSQPRFFDSVTNRMHDFCSKRHAKEAMAHPGGGMGASKCTLKGCFKDVYRDLITGLESDYCSRGHQAHAIALGQGMGTVRSHVEQVFRGGTTGATDFKLSVLSKSHPQYSSLCHQFISKWVKGGVPHVRRILEVKVPADIYGKYVNYKQAKGNVRRRFHGTSCSARCNFFVDLKGNPCSSKECNVCNICTNGFMLQGNVGGTARRTSIGLRYGEGLYFSSVTGKSNDYAQGSEKVSSDGKRLRCMFVANVAAGNAYLTQQVSLGLNMCPPAGHDSVVGEVRVEHALSIGGPAVSRET
ncbi:unnamed protein product, partial [Ectocarpus sp. 12 AP-2014]